MSLLKLWFSLTAKFHDILQFLHFDTIASWLPFWCYCHHSKDCRIDVPFDGSIEIDQEIVECTFYCAFVGFSKINFIVKSDFVRKKQIYVHTYRCTIAWISNLTVKNLMCSVVLLCKMSPANNYDPVLLKLQKSALGIM